MASYTYKLYKNNRKTSTTASAKQYIRRELELMTTHQLREICIKEKLVASMMNTMERYELIELIMRYLGAAENILITKNVPGGQERLEKLASRSTTYLDNTKAIQNPSRIVIYEGLDTDKYDRYVITAPGVLEESNVLLVSGGNELCAIFNLVADKNKAGRFYLVRKGVLPAKESQHKNYSLLYFAKRESETLYNVYNDENFLLPQNIKCYKLPLLNFAIKEPMDMVQPLAIDFGTTNTTAGLYLDRELYSAIDKGGAEENLLRPDEINLVEVFCDTEEGEILTPLIPSVVGVWSIQEDEDDIQYIFGHEAVKLARTNNIHEGFCVFFDIKRWIRDYNRQEEITDRTGRRIFKKRKEIIKAYLEHIVAVAERRFKCRFKTLHLSSPVKEKQRFLDLFGEILSDWKLETENMLDEGAAVLFNTISSFIEKNSGRHIDKEVHQALVIDCGGGTTDLSSCVFSIESKRVSYKIDIETTYENGDTDFGGNNLTFRIMQLIKIMLAENLTQSGTKSRDILAAFASDIYREVDDAGVNAVYEALDSAYAQAEVFIPTCFKNYESGSPKEYFQVKNNFYFLFQLAEDIKTEMFAGRRYQRIIIDNDEQEVPRNGEKVLAVGRWRISVRDGLGLKTLRDIPLISFSLYDISLLLKADIYDIIRKFIEEQYASGQLTNYSVIKLTGQSCKIDLFKDALKEFIPGRVIEFGGREGVNGPELKLSCLRGAIKYLKAKKGGYAEVTMCHRPAILPYIITALTHIGEEKVLITNDGVRNIGGHISRYVEGVALKLQLKNLSGEERFTYVYENRREDFCQVVYEEIQEKYGDIIIQDETDNIIENEIKYFVWPRESQWGFSVVPVLRQYGSLYLGREELFTFENDLWETNFFDGLK
ncbi:MAG: molecular chaperone [Pelosinus sp.]|nr:molecular chaperone [Pelosinus sp.]